MIVIALFLAAAPAAARAQEWTPAAYVRAVLGASPELEQSRQGMASAQARHKADIANAALPSLSAQAFAYPYGDNPANGFAFNSWRLNRRDASVNAGLSWNLFNSFADYLQVKSSSLTRDIARRDLEAAMQEQALRALRTYYGLLLQNKLLDVSRQNFNAQKAQYELTQDLYRHGMKSLSDLLKTETDWRGAELGLESAEAERRLALFRFNTLLERSAEEAVSLKEELSPSTTALPRLEPEMRRALQERPEAVRSRLELERSRVSWQQSLRGSLPSLTFDYRWNYQESATFGLPSSNFGIKNPSNYFFLTLALPSGFNLVSQTQNIRAASADLSGSRSAKDALERRIREEIFSAHNQLTRALRSFQVSARKEEISKRNLDIVTQQYRQGSADVIRLSQAQVDYVSSQVERMRAFHDANINRAEYRRALGEPLWE